MFNMYHFVLIRVITSCFGGVQLTENHDKPYDYSEYLGPNYQKAMPAGKKVPTIVSNHNGLIDGFWAMQSKFEATTVN